MSAAILFTKPKPRSFLRLAALFTAVLSGLAVYQFGNQINQEGLVVTSLNFRLALWGWYFATVVFGLVAVLTWTRFEKNIMVFLGNAQTWLNKLGVVAIVFFFAILLAIPFVVLGFYGRFLLNPFPRLFLFWAAMLLAASLLTAWQKRVWIISLPAAALGVTAVYLAAAFLNFTRSFPFSLEWSEISRYYQASFYFAKQVYGVPLPLPVTHPSRYLLQSLPFLISSSPIWLHRLWQAILWIALPLLTGWLMAKRLGLKAGLLSVFVGWSFLFLLQGPVYYHLLPCVFLVLLGFDKNRPARSFLFVALASVWAGISRVNWFPVPGAIAALLYLLEVKPARGTKAISIKYLWQPVVYAFGGTLVALAAYAVYIRISGVQDISQFGSSFTSELLWDRLLPNSAFPLGVLLGIALVSAPLLAVIRVRLGQTKSSIGFWRILGIVGLLLVFFAGGLVVSVKIGGGTNLHNLDAYLVLLWIFTSVLGFGPIATEAAKSTRAVKISAPLTAALLAVPILFAVFSGAPLTLPNRGMTDQALAQIQELADQALQKGGDVLFISQRHLLTFHLIKNVPLVPEYEKLFLMEMAISNNRTYLDNFQKDIDQQRFTLIITDPLFTKIEDLSEDVLAPENNAWVRNVSRPILCAYEPAVTYSDLNIQLLTPRTGDKCDQ